MIFKANPSIQRVMSHEGIICPTCGVVDTQETAYWPFTSALSFLQSESMLQPNFPFYMQVESLRV